MLDTIAHRDGRARTTAYALTGVPRRLAAGRYVDGLRLELAITTVQSDAWERFADSLRANSTRMGPRQDANVGMLDSLDAVFGTPQERLAALGTMRIAARELLALLTAPQRRKAERLLPLCCLPAVVRA